jgi:hypothetical protein
MGRLTRKIMLTVAAAVMLGSAGTSAALAASTTNAGSTTKTASTTNTASVKRSALEAAASVPRCYPQDLSASLHGAQIGSGYHVGFILTLTNNGQRSCSLYGYPGLESPRGAIAYVLGLDLV